MNQVLELFGDIESFLRKDDDFSSATCTKLLSFFNDTQKRVMLKVELATVVHLVSILSKRFISWKVTVH